MKLLSLKFFVLIFLLAFVFVFCYRISETYGLESQSGCAKAIILTISAAIAGFLPVIFTYAHNKTRVFFAGILIGAVVRMLITVSGILAVIYLFKEHRAWFLGWTGVFYLFSLVLETGFVVYFLNKRHNQTKGIEIDGIGVFTGKYESS